MTPTRILLLSFLILFPCCEVSSGAVAECRWFAFVLTHHHHHHQRQIVPHDILKQFHILFCGMEIEFVIRKGKESRHRCLCRRNRKKASPHI